MAESADAAQGSQPVPPKDRRLFRVRVEVAHCSTCLLWEDFVEPSPLMGAEAFRVSMEAWKLGMKVAAKCADMGADISQAVLD